MAAFFVCRFTNRGIGLKTSEIKNIVIVGGGTAGWLTAAVLSSHNKSKLGRSLNITLIESPDVKPISVGEGTWPTMRETLQGIGVSETDFFNECDACFKQGAKFAKWVTGKEDDAYYHPLDVPEAYLDFNLLPHWLGGDRSTPFAEAVCIQDALCESGVGPKLISTPEYDFVANYAYHLDSAKFSEFLKNHVISNLDVKHLLQNVKSVIKDEDGFIEAVDLENGERVEGDFFVDCSGFKSLLLGDALGVPFVNKKDVLPIDTALAIQVPYEDEQDPIASHTISTAQSAGWIWDIGLQTRRGVGHVYDSNYISEEEAAEELYSYLRETGISEPEKIKYRKIPIVPGHREKLWEKNCVGIGLAAGFLEPLEASSLVLVEMSARTLADLLPVNRGVNEVVSEKFNRKFLYAWDRIIDFLKLHYILSQREDTPFWRDIKREETVPQTLKSDLKLWKYHSPSVHDYNGANEVFPAVSYDYVLYGMGYETDLSHKSISEEEKKRAQELFEYNKKRSAKLVQMLPSNRHLVSQIRKYGLKKI